MDPPEEARRALAAVASVLAKRDGPRWRTLSGTDGKADLLPLFRGPDGGPLPVVGVADPDFAAAGLVRPPVDLRAEAIAYLLACGEATASDVARAVGYTLPGVRAALAELAEGGFLWDAPRRGYRIDRGRWGAFLGSVPHPLFWVRWPRVFAALSHAVSTLEDIEQEARSDYLRHSALLRLHDALRETLADSGLPGLMFAPARLETAPDAVQEILTSLHAALNEPTAPVSAIA